MGCKGICLSFVTTKGFYQQGNKYCYKCSVWLPNDNIRCPCCGQILRKRKR